MVTAIIYSGFSRAGKSTAGQIFKNFGISTTSTSAYISGRAATILSKLSGYDYTSCYKMLDRKRLEDDKICLHYTGFTCRNWKIYVAEKIIVANIGRNGMVDATAHLLAPGNHIFACESIGGAETDLWVKSLKKRYLCCHIEFLNIRSYDEENDGSRWLLESSKYTVTEIWNLKESRESFKRDLKRYLEHKLRLTLRNP
jgi:hypothetical protein